MIVQLTVTLFDGTYNQPNVFYGEIEKASFTVRK